MLLAFGKHLGGMTSGGLSYTDIGDKGAFGGMARELYARIGAHYGKENEQWSFEPHIAELTLNEMAKEAGATVFLSNIWRALR